MTSNEHTILNHYNIGTLYPTAWPEEKDESDLSENEKPDRQVTHLAHKHSKSRYSALERSGSDRRSLVPGSEKTGDGVENLVQKDEPDPLGGPESVVRLLRRKGLPVEEDQRLRNRFLLSSTTFSPTLYLSEVHSDTSTQSLLQGLESLSRSIDQKSASLKVLVESNFERFVRAKTTIDNVYSEMRNQGAELPAPERRRRHSRITSRGSTHFRSSSAQGPPTPIGVNKPLPSDKKKHALTKESDYGVQGIKAPLIEAVVKAEEIWGPALGGRDREEKLKTAMASAEKNSGVFQVGAAISDCIRRKDYDSLADEYNQARKYAEQAHGLANGEARNRRPLTDPELYQIVVTGRMWSDVETQIDAFKRDIWRRLTNVEANPPSAGRGPPEEHMALIKILLNLGVEDSPIWLWLLSRYDYLKNKITASFERSRVEIEVLRRRLANAPQPPPQGAAYFLKNLGQREKSQSLDTAPILELWDLIYSSVDNLLSAPGGILGEVVDFWEKAQTFIDGKVQKTLPIGYNGQSRRHHRLSTDGVRDLQNGVVELIEILRESLFAFFADPPIEDISLLYSPLPPTTPSTPKSAVFSPYAHQDSRFKFDAGNPPPPSPRRGEAWEEFAFWPPYANSISGIHYLGKLLGLLGPAAVDMATVRPVASSPTIRQSLKTLVAGARERCVGAVCAAWSRDAEICKYLEDWTRTTDRRDLTTMPSHFSLFENMVLSGLQKLLFIQDHVSKPGIEDMVPSPTDKLVGKVRERFASSLLRTLAAMLDVLDKPIAPDQLDASWRPSKPGSSSSVPSGSILENGKVGESPLVRLLLTLSNLRFFQTDVVPQLITQFENNFSVKLTAETQKIKDALSQIDAKLFKAYCKPIIDRLGHMVHSGISSPTWVPTTNRPTEVRSYIYEALLLLVNIHTQLSTTAPPLLPSMLSHLFENFVMAFLSAFRSRSGRNTFGALMQATLDVEFVAQTMSQFTTKRASDLQSQIYEELEKGTDNDTRVKLQSELPQMRTILKTLREGTRGEFGCFKKQRPKG